VEPVNAEVRPVEVRTPSPSEHAIQLDLGLAVVGLAYERRIATQIAIQLEGHVFGTWFGPMVGLPNLSGYGAGIRPTFFLSDEPSSGYVAPFLRVDRVSVDKTGATQELGYSTGAFFGYSVSAGHFNVRAGAGLQWMAYDVFVGPRRESVNTFFPALDLVVGYAF
jgi:hypothetical protein